MISSISTTPICNVQPHIYPTASVSRYRLQWKQLALALVMITPNDESNKLSFNKMILYVWAYPFIYSLNAISFSMRCRWGMITYDLWCYHLRHNSGWLLKGVFFLYLYWFLYLYLYLLVFIITKTGSNFFGISLGTVHAALLLVHVFPMHCLFPCMPVPLCRTR